MIDFHVAFDKLASLDTADEIADLLRSYNIKAVIGDANNCAISAWMQEQTGQSVSTILISTMITRTYAQIINHVGQDWKRDNTDAIQGFIAKFDNYQYPDLVDMEKSFPH